MSVRDASGRQTPTYTSWIQMHSRCYNARNKDFHRYGGRGIGVAWRWHKFETFLADMGERPRGATLDRRNNDAWYGPDNCRWATPTEQSRNRSNNKLSAADADRIRQLAKYGTLQRDIAAMYGIAQTMVSKIVRGAAWRLL